MATSQYQEAVSERPIARQAIKLATAGTVGLSCLALSGLTMTGTVLGVVVITPLLLLFSPVLVPAALALLLAAIGIVVSGTCGVAALAAVSWVYSYVNGSHPIASDALDHVLQETASEIKDQVDDAVQLKDKAPDKGRKGQHKANQGS